MCLCRSSRPDVFYKKGILRNFAKFTGTQPCQSFFFNKVAGLAPATLLKKRLWHRCFPVNFVKFLRTPFYIEHLWWLLLLMCNSFRRTASFVEHFIFLSDKIILNQEVKKIQMKNFILVFELKSENEGQCQ